MIKEHINLSQLEEDQKLQIEKLTQDVSDLEIALMTAVEHGDSIEEELLATNQALTLEAKERLNAEKRLKNLIKALTQQKDDLELLVETITAHGDDVQYEWLEKLGAAEEEAMTDALTSVSNRRYFDQYLSSEWCIASRHKSCFSIIMIDIDHFKYFNDCYGHQAGDECIKKIARACKDICHRETDLFARYGGEEFAIVLPATNYMGALSLADKLLTSVESLSIPHEKSSAADHVTISVGVASMQVAFGEEATELLKLADDMLYKAKELGRNRAVGEIKKNKV